MIGTDFLRMRATVFKRSHEQQASNSQDFKRSNEKAKERFFPILRASVLKSNPPSNGAEQECILL